MPSFATSLVLVNLVLVASSNLPIYDVENVGEINRKIDLNPVTPDRMSRLVRAGGFIGDLTIGERRPGEFIYTKSFTIRNPVKNVTAVIFDFTVAKGSIHYINVENLPGSESVICDRPYSLGLPSSSLAIRVLPESSASVRVFAAAH